jgi:RNA ligase partner protein
MIIILMEKFVIDTNFFVNLEIKSGFGNNPKAVVSGFTSLAQKLKEEKTAEFFMPPRIVEEFLGFFGKDNLIKDLLSITTIKSPEVSQLQFSAEVFYQLIDEVRERAYRGLRIAEEAVVDGAKKMIGRKEYNKIEFEKRIGSTVKNLRERYRNATRVNFLDSLADLDLIVLTKEIDGFLVSADEGVIRWGRIFGIKEVSPPLFRERLLSLLTQKK